MNSIQQIARIFPIHLFKDNYSYLILSKNDRKWGILIDPAEPNKIIEFLENFKETKISHVLFTHKHWDHIGKPLKLRKKLFQRDDYKELIFAASQEDSEFIDDINWKLEGNHFFIINNFRINNYLVPCHTRGHTIYHFTNFQKDINDEKNPQKNNFIENNSLCFESDNFLFTGDTLFIGGCGRFFEGTAEEMLENFDRISSLNESTLIFCGHEYTIENLLWSQKIRKNFEIEEMIKKIKQQEKIISIPSSVYQEKKINIFMQCHDENLQKILGYTNAIETMKTLRNLKNEGKNISHLKLQQFKNQFQKKKYF